MFSNAKMKRHLVVVQVINSTSRLSVATDSISEVLMVDRCRSGADVERPGHMFLQQTPQSLLITFLIVSILARGSSSCSRNTSNAANINSCPPSAGRFPPRGADEQPVNLFFIWRNYRQSDVAPQAAATLRTLLLPGLQNFIKGHLSSSGSGGGSLH